MSLYCQWLSLVQPLPDFISAARSHFCERSNIDVVIALQSPMISLPITWPTTEIKAFCEQWLVAELSLFGSILRKDFHADSDIDVLIAFTPEADWSLFDHVRMQEALTALLKRKVDLVSKRAIERSHNPIRRKNILSTAQVIYSQNARV